MGSNHAPRIGSTEEAIMRLRTIGLIGTLVLGLFPDRERWGNVSEI